MPASPDLGANATPPPAPQGCCSTEPPAALAQPPPPRLAAPRNAAPSPLPSPDPRRGRSRTELPAPPMGSPGSPARPPPPPDGNERRTQPDHRGSNPLGSAKALRPRPLSPPLCWPRPLTLVSAEPEPFRSGRTVVMGWGRRGPHRSGRRYGPGPAAVRLGWSWERVSRGPGLGLLLVEGSAAGAAPGPVSPQCPQPGLTAPVSAPRSVGEPGAAGTPWLSPAFPPKAADMRGVG